MRTALVATALVATAFVVLAAAADPPAAASRPGRTCYSNLAGGTGSLAPAQQFERELEIYDTEAAEDVRIGPRPCRLRTLVVVGGYFNGAGPARAQTVSVYADADGRPGRVVDRQTVRGLDDEGRFTIPLDPVRLRARRAYWIGVRVDMHYDPYGQWGWETTRSLQGQPGMWRNPGDGLGAGCPTWDRLEACSQGFWFGSELLLALSERRTGLAARG